MVTLDLAGDRPALTLPTWEDARAMIRDRAVAIVAIICATVVLVAALAAIVALAIQGRDAAVVAAFVGGPVLSLAVLFVKRRNGCTGKETSNEGPQSA